MYTTHRSTITIQTDIGDYSFSFNPSVAHGWEEIHRTLDKHITDENMARVIAKKDREAGAVYLIQKQAENADAFISCIKTVAGDEFQNIADVVNHIDLSDLIHICTSIADAYMEYYRQKLKEGLEP